MSLAAILHGRSAQFRLASAKSKQREIHPTSCVSHLMLCDTHSPFLLSSRIIAVHIFIYSSPQPLMRHSAHLRLAACVYLLHRKPRDCVSFIPGSHAVAKPCNPHHLSPAADTLLLLRLLTNICSILRKMASNHIGTSNIHHFHDGLGRRREDAAHIYVFRLCT